MNTDAELPKEVIEDGKECDQEGFDMLEKRMYSEILN